MPSPDFLSLQVRDPQASSAFYQQHLGLVPAPAPGPEVVLFPTATIPFAVRTALPGVDLAAIPQPGAGVALWFHDERAAELHDRMAAAGVDVVQAPFEGPFGTTFSFRDPDGYVLTVHSRG